MSKFTELAARAADMRKKFDARADDLSLRMDGFDSRASAAFEKHEAALNQAESDVREMEEALRDLAGGNNPPGERDEREGSPASSAASFQEGGSNG